MQSRIQPSSELLGQYRIFLREIDPAISLREAEGTAIELSSDFRGPF